MRINSVEIQGLTGEAGRRMHVSFGGGMRDGLTPTSKHRNWRMSSVETAMSESTAASTAASSVILLRGDRVGMQ